MPNAICVLEALGGRPALLAAGYFVADAQELEDQQRQALLACDPAALNELLGGNRQMFCYVTAPQKDAPDSVPDNGDDGEGGHEVPDEQEPSQKE